MTNNQEIKRKTLSKGKKVAIGIVSALLIIAVILGATYAISPRAFLKLILSDVTYTEVVLSKNLGEMFEKYSNLSKKASEKLAFKTNGKIKTQFKEGEFLNKEVTDAAEEYINTLNLDSTIFFSGNGLKLDSKLNDNEGTVLTTNTYASTKGSVFFKINEFDTGYMYIFNATGEKKENSYKNNKLFSLHYNTGDIDPKEIARVGKEIHMQQ